MTQLQTDLLIRETAKRLFAQHGYEGVSMRLLAKESGVGLSSIYHFFKDKDVLLTAVYDEVNQRLGAARKALHPQPTAEIMLGQLIDFQIDHIDDVVFVMKYYVHYRQDFALLPTKTLPAKAVLHVEEVLLKGLETGEFDIPSEDVTKQSKIIAHIIGGFLLEYYPDVPRGWERDELISNIVTFSMRGLKVT